MKPPELRLSTNRSSEVKLAAHKAPAKAPAHPAVARALGGRTVELGPARASKFRRWRIQLREFVDRRDPRGDRLVVLTLAAGGELGAHFAALIASGELQVEAGFNLD